MPSRKKRHAGHRDPIARLQSFGDFDFAARDGADLHRPRRDFAIGTDDPDNLLAAVSLGDGRDRHQDAIAEDARPAVGHRHGGRHAGQRADAVRDLHGGADFEGLRRRVGDLSDLANSDRELQVPVRR